MKRFLSVVLIGLALVLGGCETFNKIHDDIHDADDKLHEHEKDSEK